MRKTTIFVSSTCYDLRALREHIKTEIEGLGHEALLSEYPSFPVSPDLSTVDNCKRVVQESADIFVLIIGGKRGSLDPATLKSVVNVEYIEARRKGLDCFVFVDKQVLDLLPHYKKNPDADFSPTVDNSYVFKFIDEVSSSSKWMFGFNRTEEIISILKHQMSVRFRGLLKKSREGHLAVPKEFLAEPEAIREIVIYRHGPWEYRLASELLKDRLGAIDRKFADITRGLAFRRTHFLSARDSFSTARELLSDFSRIVEVAGRVLNDELAESFGPPGVHGDAGKIKRACDNLYALFNTMYEWEMDARFIQPHEYFESLFATMHGWSEEVLEEFRRIPREIDAVLSNPEASGTFHIGLTIRAPSGLARFQAEIERLAGDPTVLLAVSTE